MNVNRKTEQTAAAWAWRALLGPAMLLDGLLSTLTIGTLSAGTALKVSRRLAMARYAGFTDEGHASIKQIEGDNA